MRAAVLVEGRSDSAALERLAGRRGRDLAAEGVAVVAMGGATNIRRYLERLGPRGLGLDLAGLCDVAEVGYYRRGLAAAGLGADLTRAQLEQRGFFVCVADLEDELIRALGTDAVEAVIDERGELGSFRTMQQQPAQRDRPLTAQLRRFLGTRGGRKIAYAPALVDALDLDRVPAPLDGVLGAV
ncbi:TOPRIM nucleotidyl transferase/hydrolase domain-containing protein [Occultella kanbiaonis]|uniref:TOPRIM nucleotidyl transferase/hydrolase domain-containing protein n=1 Tax=Occultella kanbiaonis TaxID=2675754 RepID=UPI0012B7AEA4|nr:TOPRIM nucleotidyl transferase/hydrolase domain-containing protein [Occultella kanbiaonis]